MHLIFFLPWYLSALILVGAFVALAVAGLFFVRSRFHHTLLIPNHEVAGVVFGIIGIFYSVLLGLMITTAQERYNQAYQNTEDEASAIVSLYRDVQKLPIEVRAQIRHALESYVEKTIHEEWSLIPHGKLNLENVSEIQHLWSYLYNYKSLGEEDKIWYTQAIEKLNEIGSLRLHRIFCANKSMSSQTWSLLLLGCVTTVGFVYFFGMKNLRVQVIITMCLSATLAFMLYILFCLDNPFMGDTGIPPITFEWAQVAFQYWKDYIGQ